MCGHGWLYAFYGLWYNCCNPLIVNLYISCKNTITNYTAKICMNSNSLICCLRKIFLTALVVTFCTTAFAQKTITGTVTDASGVPVIGAGVMVAETLTGGVTDVDGKFSITASDGQTVEVSCLGYESWTFVVTASRSVYNVILPEDLEMLDETVVIGYGSVKAADLTGSISSVKNDKLAAVTASNTMTALQGQIPGLRVTSNSRPGESPTMRIRGNGSISAGNDPLYVVDGFPMMNSSMSDLSAYDIERIEVLKDASATAIYGSRGSNGVIMITTKSGRPNTKNLTFNANFGIQTPGRLLDIMTHDQFVDYINCYYMNKQGITIYNEANPAPDTNTDWQDELIADSRPVQDYNITLDGSSGDTNYLLSGSIFRQDGLIASSYFNRYSFRSNIDHKFSERLKVGTHLQYTYSDLDKAEPLAGEGLTSIWRTGWNTLPVWREDGTPARPSDNPAISPYFGNAREWNPVWNYTQQTDYSAISRLFGDVYAEFSIAKGLTFRTNFGLDMANQRDYNYVTNGNTTSEAGSGGQAYLKKMSRITENVLTYENEWNRHRLTATAVYSWQDYVYEEMSMSGKGFVNDETGAWDMSQASRETLDYGSDKYSNRLISMTARLSYGYDDRYLVTLTARRDGSSRFGTNNKWGFFPSVGLAWRASEEQWLKDSRWLTYLKFRASFGVTGNQEIGNYKSLARLLSHNYIYQDGEIKGFYETIGNEDLKWERANQFDVGVDFALFNRINVTADWYRRITSDLLYEVPIPSTSGFKSILSNVGSVMNNGAELSLNANLVRTSDWNVNLAFNFSWNDNRITGLYGDVQSITLSSSLGGSTYLKVGEPLNSRYMLISDGIIKTDEQLAEYRKIQPTAKLGDEMYKDLDKDGSITVEDQRNIGTTDPKFLYGFALDAGWKNLSLSVLGSGASDYVIGTSYLVIAENQIEGAQGVPGRWAYERMWTPDNPDGFLPSPGANNVQMSDRIAKDKFYYVIKSIALNYDFGENPFKWLPGVRGLQAGVNFQNFITFANQRGYNPENGDTSYPWVRTVNLSLNLKF